MFQTNHWYLRWKYNSSLVIEHFYYLLRVAACEIHKIDLYLNNYIRFPCSKNDLKERKKILNHLSISVTLKQCNVLACRQKMSSSLLTQTNFFLLSLNWTDMLPLKCLINYGKLKIFGLWLSILKTWIILRGLLYIHNLIELWIESVTINFPTYTKHTQIIYKKHLYKICIKDIGAIMQKDASWKMQVKKSIIFK